MAYQITTLYLYLNENKFCLAKSLKYLTNIMDYFTNDSHTFDMFLLNKPQTLFLQERRGGPIMLDGEHDDVARVAQDVHRVVVLARCYVLAVHCNRVLL